MQSDAETLAWLAFKHTPDGRIGEAARDALAERLRNLPCPVIALAPAGALGPLIYAADVVVSEERRLPGLIAAIERAPLAAATLVQVLRAGAGLPIEAALTLESLAYGVLQAGPEFAAWRAAQVPLAPPLEAGPPVLMRRRQGALDLLLNRPLSRNALSAGMRDGLAEALELVLADPTITRVRLAGAGKCFSTGGELSEFGRASDPASAHQVRMRRLPARLLARCAARVEVMLHGACIGAGIEIPAFAGRITAQPDSFFQLPELAMGLIPGAGGTVGIARRIGRQRTAYMALSGRRLSATTALSWGLIDALSS